MVSGNRGFYGYVVPFGDDFLGMAFLLLGDFLKCDNSKWVCW